jgi:hypothetical protein
MFQDLDATLKTILDDASAPLELRNADVIFEPPDKSFAPGQATVNLFLYEVKENRELRDPVPIIDTVAGVFVRRKPPLRVDCSYLVTAWSNQIGANKIVEEHRLLSLALAWLSRFPTIPTTFFQGSLIGQPFPPPTLVAQLDGGKSVAEFWSALGIAPRPSFNLIATIALDLQVQTPEGPPVVTKEIEIKRKMPPGVPEPTLDVTYEIGGRIGDANTLAAIANAQVKLLELEREVVTDQEGHFRFADLAAGNYTLRAAAVGYISQTKAIVVPGAVLNAYDINLTP